MHLVNIWVVKNDFSRPNLVLILVRCSEVQRNQHDQVHQRSLAIFEERSFLPQCGWDVKGSECDACKFARIVVLLPDLQQLSDWELPLELWTVGGIY